MSASACAAVPARRGGAAPGDPILDTVGDVAVVASEPEGFDALTREERLLAWHLSQAAMAGHRIALGQNYRFDPAIWDLVEGLYARRDRLDPGFAVLLGDYRRRVFLHGGIHDAITQEKFLPAFTPRQLQAAAVEAVAAGARLGAGVAVSELSRVMFDPESDAFRVRKTLGPAGDPIKASAANHYAPGVGVWELQGFADAFPRNSRITLAGGQLVEEPYRAGAPGVEPGLGAAELAAAAAHLEAAAALAPPEEQEALGRLALSLRTGRGSDMDEHDALWAPHAFAVDYAIGFLETRSDPRGLKGVWSGAVAVRDPAEDTQLRRVTALVEFFEERLPWPAHWKRPAGSFRAPAAAAVHLLATAGAFVAFPPAGLTLPQGPPQARAGSKSWLVLSTLEAGQLAVGDRLVEELVFPDSRAEAARCWRAVERARVATREILGRSAGRLPPGAPDPREALAPYHAVVEEARADALALLLLDDRKGVVAGILPDAGCQIALAPLVAMEPLVGLAAAPHAETVEDDRLRASLLIQGWLAERGAVRLVQRGASRYVQVASRLAWREGLAELAETLQRARATGDRPLVAALLDRHATAVDVGLRDEVVARLRRLGIPGRIAVLPPVLQPVRDPSGRVVDATARRARSVDEVIAAFQGARAGAGPP